MTPEQMTELDLAVARVEGLEARIDGDYCEICETDQDGTRWWRYYVPTRNWSDAGPLVKRYGIAVWPISDNGEQWEAEAKYWEVAGAPKGMGPDREHYVGFGPTPLIAICRAVASISSPKQGETGLFPFQNVTCLRCKHVYSVDTRDGSHTHECPWWAMKEKVDEKT